MTSSSVMCLCSCACLCVSVMFGCWHVLVLRKRKQQIFASKSGKRNGHFELLAPGLIVTVATFDDITKKVRLDMYRFTKVVCMRLKTYEIEGTHQELCKNAFLRCYDD